MPGLWKQFIMSDTPYRYPHVSTKMCGASENTLE
jgi:hypothetical protein